MTGWTVRADDLGDPRVRELVALHQRDMLAVSPPGTSYALDLTGLQGPGVQVWSAWAGDQLGGVVALAARGDGSGELKSMRTHPDHLRQGVAGALLAHVLRSARACDLDRVVLETGTSRDFAAAVALYRRAGFTDRGPFGGYRAGPDNQFLELRLEPARPLPRTT